MPAIARFSVVALDCPDARALAEFYAGVTGWAIRDDDEDWAELLSGAGATIAFQRVDDFTPPQWPGQQHPQQLHLDFEVDDLDRGEADVIALGARKADVQPGVTFRVFVDPAGHPFCLLRAG